MSATPEHGGGSDEARMTHAEERDLKAAYERDKWAGEWNSLPTAIDRLLRARAAAPDALRERVEALHVALDEMPFGPSSPVCAACGHLLPCPTLALLDDSGGGGVEAVAPPDGTAALPVDPAGQG